MANLAINHTVCQNCLLRGARAVEVGAPKGTQYDPYRDKVYLCGICEDALLSGNFKVLSEYYKSEATIKNKS
jgi:hypothetical protein